MEVEDDTSGNLKTIYSTIIRAKRPFRVGTAQEIAQHVDAIYRAGEVDNTAAAAAASCVFTFLSLLFFCVLFCVRLCCPASAVGCLLIQFHALLCLLAGWLCFGVSF